MKITLKICGETEKRSEPGSCLVAHGLLRGEGGGAPKESGWRTSPGGIHGKSASSPREMHGLRGLGPQGVNEPKGDKD